MLRLLRTAHARRIRGLTDDEYFWGPVPDCWSVRPSEGDGVLTHDWQFPAPDPPPVTTIAWRLAHMCSFLQEHGLRAVAFERGAAAWRPPSVVPGTAVDAVDALSAAVVAWRRDLSTVDDQRLWEPMGPAAGPFADQPVAGFVEHIHDEFVHHGAEVALLRDLYRVDPQLGVARSR
jgi:uncharacterized damage-inducible protein DinB